ncbi:hypothetical protein NQ318_019093 [Aromia moschata]|uniref:Uncharacterized protein n=1 Tax=Aromia moschata TaxID=1265417 RepID=A0AAV8Y783_9CUCU|nr:hypothetical protein NQ318_019093 [Aromia moschata]
MLQITDGSLETDEEDHAPQDDDENPPPSKKKSRKSSNLSNHKMKRYEGSGFVKETVVEVCASIIEDIPIAELQIIRPLTILKDVLEKNGMLKVNRRNAGRPRQARTILVEEEILEHYLDFLQNTLPDLFDDLPLNLHNQMYFIHTVPHHTLHVLIDNYVIKHEFSENVINGCILNLSPFRIPSVNTISILFGRSVTNPLDARSLFPTPLVSDCGTGIDNTIVDRASVQYEKANTYCYCLPLHN